jgi:tyrosyl-tRNA synthetase
MTSVSELDDLTRGCVDVVTPESLKQKLARGKPLTVKVGFDPTAPDIHLGHTVLMRKMRQFQERGHRVVFVIGDFTGMIGDPTGKSKTRPPLTRDEIAHNAETYKKQAFKILDPSKTEVRFNREWLGPLASDEWIRLTATYNVARMLERRDFRQRFDVGQSISVHEFLYPLAQAYDSVALNADVELGGTDQLFNLNVGRDIMPSYGLEPQVVMTTPLLEGTDGVEKMSKSLGNYIGVAESPNTIFAKILSISDELMWKYYLHLTDLSAAAVEREKQKGQPMQSKIALARRIVADFHDLPAGENAEAEWRRVHQSGELPSEMPMRDLPAQTYKANQLLVEIGEARSKNGDVPSKSEATRLIKQGAVKIDHVVISDPMKEIAVAVGAELIVSIGRKRFVRVRGTSS